MRTTGLVLAVFLSSVAAQEYLLKNVYRDSDSYEERYLLDSPYNLCREPLVARANLSATSEMLNRGTADHAGLWSGAAWTAERSDFSQVTFGSSNNIEISINTKNFRLQQTGIGSGPWVDHERDRDRHPGQIPLEGVRHRVPHPIRVKWERLDRLQRGKNPFTFANVVIFEGLQIAAISQLTLCKIG